MHMCQLQDAELRINVGEYCYDEALFLAACKRSRGGKAKTTSDSDVGTGGMYSKVKTANLINNIGIDMIITNGKNPDNMLKVLNGTQKGTLFRAFNNKIEDIRKYLIANIIKEEK